MFDRHLRILRLDYKEDERLWGREPRHLRNYLKFGALSGVANAMEEETWAGFVNETLKSFIEMVTSTPESDFVISNANFLIQLLNGTK